MDQQQPTNAQIMEMLREQNARTAQLEAENVELKATTQQVAAENAELKATTQRVEAELERQRLEKLSLSSGVNEVEGGPAPHDKKLTRAGLFKAAAMGSAAVVGAGALGTLGAEHAAASTDVNFNATGTASVGFDTSSGTFALGADLRGSSVGVEALAAGAGSIGIHAQGSMYAAELSSGSPASAQLHFVPTGAPGAPTTGFHYPGEVYVDSAARIYRCAASGSPGTWVPLNALVPIAPVRVLDTRSGTRVGASTGPFGTGTTLTFAIAGQTFTTSSGSFTFPNNIVGVVGNLVAVTPTGAGYLVAYPQGTTLPTTASVNFVPPGTGSDVYYAQGNHVTVALSALGQVTIYVGLVAGANVQVVLDIAGYVM